MFEVLRRATWTDRAACRDAETARFYVNTKADALPVIEEYCAGCPVQEECLEYGLSNNLTESVWGGEYLTHARRGHIYRTRRRSAARAARLEAAS